MQEEGIQRSWSEETVLPVSGCEEKGHVAHCTPVPCKNLGFLEYELQETDLPAASSCDTTDEGVILIRFMTALSKLPLLTSILKRK